MTTDEIKVGTKVVANGYAGTVIEVCSWEPKLIVIRLDSGDICTPRSDFNGQYENNYIVSL